MRGDFGKAMAAPPGAGAAVLLAPDSHQRGPSGPEHAACRGVLRSRVNRRADSSGPRRRSFLFRRDRSRFSGPLAGGTGTRQPSAAPGNAPPDPCSSTPQDYYYAVT